MKYFVVNLLLFMACLSVSCLLWAVSPVPAPTPDPATGDFTARQQAEIEYIVESYLVAHPDLLAKLSQPQLGQAVCPAARQ
ncbi:hypothetical protein [Acerihabitans arboris]|uniref:Uncharacterized protein n=1 Tax=Acerihabitans arboris TaxID=2691583 RepID=A0A845SGZ9_9GAMM|nr:hypothetical protein [Acerihabitans arboris]NDL64383.1 hypothetical protein [Acerihabitans arboris]